MTVTWPSVLEARSWNANLRNMMASGGRSPTGRDQRSFSDAGFWEISISGIRVHNREEAAAFRALIARLRSGEDIIVPLRDLYGPVGSRLNAAATTLTSAAALRATALGLSVTAIDIQAGHHLSIGDRLHLVTEVVTPAVAVPIVNPLVTGGPWSSSVPWTASVSRTATVAVKILPPLRADYGSGATVSFRDLAVRCVLKNPDDGDLDLDLGRLGTPSLNLIESL